MLNYLVLFFYSLEIKFQHEKIKIDLDLENMMVQGLAVSSNGILCSVILKYVVLLSSLFCNYFLAVC